MKINLRWGILPALLLILGAGGFFIGNCSSSSSDVSDIAKLHNGTYIGIGSSWQYTLRDDGTCQALKSDARGGPVVRTIDCTYEVLKTGYYRMTVTKVTNVSGSGGPSVGDKAFGFAVPNVVLMIQPDEPGKEFKVMPSIGTCPTETQDFNWVKARTMELVEGDMRSEALWGNATLPAVNGEFLTGTNWILDGTEGGELQFAEVNSCTNGVIEITGKGDTPGFIVMTDAGVGLVNMNETEPGHAVIALPKDTSVNAATLAGKEFFGLLFQEEESDQGSIQPIKTVFDAAGTVGTFTLYTDIKTGATGQTGTLTITEFGSGEKAGFVKIAVTPRDGGGTPTMWGAVTSDIGGTGRAFLFATGVAGTEFNKSFSVIMIETK